jgi:hypothetical protein
MRTLATTVCVMLVLFFGSTRGSWGTEPDWTPVKSNAFLWGQLTGCVLRYKHYRTLSANPNAPKKRIEQALTNTVGNLDDIFVELLKIGKEAGHIKGINWKTLDKQILAASEGEFKNKINWLQALACYKMLRDVNLVTANPKAKPASKSSRKINSEPKRQQKVAKKDSLKFRRNIEYMNTSDGSCKPKKNKVCLSRDDYKKICQLAKGVTAGSVSKATMLDSQRVKTVFKNPLTTVNIFWVEKRNGCGVNLAAKGLYKGTTRFERVSGRATTFIVGRSGNVLVDYIDTMGN